MKLPNYRYPRPCLWIAIFAWSLASQAAVKLPGDHLVRGPYVQRATPHSICVVWRTDMASTPVVRFGANAAQLDRQAGGADILVRRGDGRSLAKTADGSSDFARLDGAPQGSFQFEACLTGLEPNQQYYYAIYEGEKKLAGGDENHRFKTHPMTGANLPVRFWVVGDSGTGRPNQAQVYAAMTNHTARENHPPDFYLHVGDLAYSRGRDAEFQAHYFEMYGATLRHTVCWAAMGNHEGYRAKGTQGTGVGPYFDAFVQPMKGEAGGVPSRTESYYSFDWGRVHFLCLNSHDEDRKPTGRMAQWIQEDLSQAKAGGQTDWLIAFFHHAPYTKGTHDSDKEKALVEVRQYLMPILEQGGVDLVLTGHSHIYERSMLMDGAYDAKTTATHVILNDGDGDPQGDGAYRKSAGIHSHQGTVQVVTGHGGATVGRKGTMPVMRKITVEHGSTLVDISGDTLSAIMLNKKGEVGDRFSVIKRGQVELRRLANPWQPPGWKANAAASTSAEPPETYVTLIKAALATRVDEP